LPAGVVRNRPGASAPGTDRRRGAAALRDGIPARWRTDPRGLARARDAVWRDRRVQAGRAGFVADDGDARTCAARAETATARAEQPPRPRPRLRQGSKRPPLTR